MNGRSGPAARQDEAEYQKQYGPKVAAEKARLQAQLDSTRDDLYRVMEDHAALDVAKAVAIRGHASVLVPLARELLKGRRDQTGGFSDETKAEVIAALRADPAVAPVVRGQSPAEIAARDRKAREMTPDTTAQKPLTRQEFDRLSPEQRLAHARSGAKILDG